MSTLFSPSQVYAKFFQRSRALHSETNGSLWPEMELAQDFMPALIIFKFEDPIKTEGAIVSITYFLALKDS